jgi:RNA polymerase sigma-70 factor, ECF subfamily
MSDPGHRVPTLTVIDAGTKDATSAPRSSPEQHAKAYELDWSILMAHAQNGDGEAYRRLLTALVPYGRSLAARCHRDPNDVEDAVQDILATLHAVRQTYDPARPFGPWFLTVANRRLIDRLGRQCRFRARETPLAPEHETFPADPANLDDVISDRGELLEAVGKLPPGQRRAIELVKLREMSLKEASAATGMTVTALKVATHRALANLRKMLSTTGRDP